MVARVVWLEANRSCYSEAAAPPNVDSGLIPPSQLRFLHHPLPASQTHLVHRKPYSIQINIHLMYTRFLSPTTSLFLGITSLPRSSNFWWRSTRGVASLSAPHPRPARGKWAMHVQYLNHSHVWFDKLLESTWKGRYHGLLKLSLSLCTPTISAKLKVFVDFDSACLHPPKS